MIFYERLHDLVRSSGKSINKIERELGYPRNAIHNYKKDTIPSATRLIELAQYFGVSPEYLFGKTEIKSTNSLMRFFHQLNDEQKIIITDICYNWLINKNK